MTAALVAYLIGAAIWGGVSYGLLGGFWWGRANDMRIAGAIVCGLIWFPSWALALYHEVRP